MLISAFALAYAAWFGFYHAGTIAHQPWLKFSLEVQKKFTLAVAWILFFLALYPCILYLSTERGIPLWFALHTGAATLFLFSNKIYPRLNKALGFGSILIAPLSFIVAIV